MRIGATSQFFEDRKKQDNVCCYCSPNTRKRHHVLSLSCLRYGVFQEALSHVYLGVFHKVKYKNKVMVPRQLSIR